MVCCYKESGNPEICLKFIYIHTYSEYICIIMSGVDNKCEINRVL